MEPGSCGRTPRISVPCSTLGSSAEGAPWLVLPQLCRLHQCRGMGRRSECRCLSLGCFLEFWPLRWTQLTGQLDTCYPPAVRTSGGATPQGHACLPSPPILWPLPEGLVKPGRGRPAADPPGDSKGMTPLSNPQGPHWVPTQLLLRLLLGQRGFQQQQQGGN